MILTLHDYAERALPFIVDFDSACEKAEYSQLKLFVQICAESAWVNTAKSDTGAIGLCQMEPATAEQWNCDPSNPASALQAMAYNMAIYEKQFAIGYEASPFNCALAAYNAGEGAVEYYKGIPPYAETQEYCAVITDTVNHASAYWPAFYRGLLAQAKALEPETEEHS
jgi:hypothetical protein